MLRPIRRALLSVSDKTGLVDFARELVMKYGVELIATGGTKKVLADAGLPVKDIAEITKFPEMLDGRVKSLHPAIFAGLLAKRDKPEHMTTLAEHQLPEIDLVVCNLYPFEQTVAKPGVTEAEAIENIDIGGPCMVRAAAKNFASVAICATLGNDEYILSHMASQSGMLTLEQRRFLAEMAFSSIVKYDRAISEYFHAQVFPPKSDFVWQDYLEKNVGEDRFLVSMSKRMNLRYGENPHQQARFYVEPGVTLPSIATAEQLHGKELSYNNILDLDSALNL
ncbi:MAG TPA: bifunctional phosphoribosylaminoimidazolecarboxamide formyltransferase/IMP cyclohydrolase, partial [Urbifossiella sp.]